MSNIRDVCSWHFSEVARREPDHASMLALAAVQRMQDRGRRDVAELIGPDHLNDVMGAGFGGAARAFKAEHRTEEKY